MNPVLEQLRQQIEATVGVAASAVTLINGIPNLIQTAVDAALANGATEAQLAPFTTLKDELAAKTAELKAAVEANDGDPNTPLAP